MCSFFTSYASLMPPIPCLMYPLVLSPGPIPQSYIPQSCIPQSRIPPVLCIPHAPMPHLPLRHIYPLSHSPLSPRPSSSIPPLFSTSPVLPCSPLCAFIHPPRPPEPPSPPPGLYTLRFPLLFSSLIRPKVTGAFFIAVFGQNNQGEQPHEREKRKEKRCNVFLSIILDSGCCCA